MFGKPKPLPRANILIPLYIYPFEGAWDPLYTAITTHPSLTFTIIINPSSGPGPTALPDANYLREIPKLNSYPNVRTVGYVSTSWTNRDLELVFRDVKVYSKWKESTVDKLGVRGIFLDETPSIWSPSCGRYLERAKEAIVAEKGFGDAPLIIHNPGTLPDPRYLRLCTLSVVFEGTYATFNTHGFSKTIPAFQKKAKCSRESMACIIHGLPAAMLATEQRDLIRNSRRVVGEIFVTGEETDCYARFWEAWGVFVGVMEGE